MSSPEGEKNINLNLGKVVRLPEAEILTNKFLKLGVLGMKETNSFWRSLAENLDRDEINGIGLVVIWEATLQKSLGQYGQMMVNLVGMNFDRVVEAISSDREFVDIAKMTRQQLRQNMRDLAKAAEPKLEDLGPEDSLDNFERFQQAHKIADIVFEYIGTDFRHAKNGRSMEDWRDEEAANPYYDQTHCGFFLEEYYGQISSVWTPWGKYKFGGSGMTEGGAPDINPTILERFGATLYQPEITDESGVHGPIYAVHRIDDVELPDPVKRPRSKYRSYEDSTNAWEKLRKQDYQARGETLPLTSAEKFQLDQDLVKERSAKEPPINEKDIRTLWELVFQKGKIVKYTRNGGKTWSYTKIGNSDPVLYSGGTSGNTLGLHADEEVLPNAQVHSSFALTEDDLNNGMVARPTTPAETNGMKFSYDFTDDEA